MDNLIPFMRFFTLGIPRLNIFTYPRILSGRSPAGVRDESNTTAGDDRQGPLRSTMSRSAASAGQHENRPPTSRLIQASETGPLREGQPILPRLPGRDPLQTATKHLSREGEYQVGQFWLSQLILGNISRSFASLRITKRLRMIAC